METGRENTSAIETTALTKMYKDKAAVKNLNLKVREGEIYGFIGRNGAGKSTTLKMLCGIAAPTEGEIRLFGKPVGDPVVRRRLGVLIESAGLYPNMTAKQNVIMKAKCMGLADEKSVDYVIRQKDYCLIFENLVSETSKPDPEQIFDRFYKADSARRKGSSGLGLFIVKELAERMNGNVKAEAEGEKLRILLYFSEATS